MDNNQLVVESPKISKYGNLILPMWYISCTTGCSCCSYENYKQGFYKTREEAQAQVTAWLTGSEPAPIGSQYAPKGRYAISSVEVEILPDGRFISEGEDVYPPDYFGKLRGEY